jgi:nitroreductase
MDVSCFFKHKSLKISKEEMTEILTPATLAPSLVNMQPWRFLVIDSPEGKAMLVSLARFNKNQWRLLPSLLFSVT